MVICDTPRPRLQPQEEVVAVVIWKKKKMWLPNTRTTKRCSSSAFKDIPRYLDYVSASRWIGCRNFCGNTGKCLKWTPYVSISSLVDTDQLSKRRRALRSAQPRRVILRFILVMTYSSDKKCHSKVEDRFIPGDSRMIRRAAEASCIILASMWLTPLKCLRTLMSFSPFPSFPIIQLELTQRVVRKWSTGRGARATHAPSAHPPSVPLPAIVHLPGSYHELADILSQIHPLWMQHILSQPI